MELPISQFDDDLRLTIGNIFFTQFVVNSIIATTGYKLQGISKDTLIVNSWNYGFANWIYVVLSRIRTLSSLYMCSPLDMNKSFKVPEKLIQFEGRVKLRETAFLNKRRQDMEDASVLQMKLKLQRN